MVNVAFEFAECEVLAEVGAGIGDGSAGVFFFGISKEIGGVAELGFDLLLAVAVIVVGDESDHDTIGIA